jgi:hypothetical protein
LTEEKKTNLTFIKIDDFNLIPRHLFEQTEGGPPPEGIDAVYTLNALVAKNPFTLLYAIADDDHRVRGFMWARADIIQQQVYIYLLSLDRECQGRGDIIDQAKEVLIPVSEQLFGKVKGSIYTNRPEAFEKKGFKRTGFVEMEFTQDIKKKEATDNGKGQR